MSQQVVTTGSRGNDAADGVRVTVVSTTHNPGPAFDDLVRSYEQQTLSTDQFEVLFCDDGSDEATQQRLTDLERTHPNFRAIRLPHSGWPGGPRNAGVREARGRYVYFCDDDDRLHPEALQRLCDFADEHGSDVVVGMMVGVGRWLNMGTFRRTIPHAKLGVDPLLDFMTPHKLFRTDFIRSHGIEYPVGKVRLEDHQFVIQAYLEASTISIYSDRPVYYWVVRKDRKSISSSRIDPATYYRDLEQVLAIVERRTNPSPFRHTLLAHWYRGKVLGRLGGERVAGYPPEHFDNLLAQARPLVGRWFPPEVDEFLPYPFRLRSALLRADDREGLIAYAAIEGGLKCLAFASEIEWTADGQLRVVLTTSVRTADNVPLRFEETVHDGTTRQVWRPPVAVSPDVLTDEVLDAAKDIEGDSIQFFVRDLVDQAIYPLSDQLPVTGAEFVLDPRTALGGLPLRARAELLLVIKRAGWTFRRRVRVRDDVFAPDARTRTTAHGRELGVRRLKDDNVLIVTSAPAKVAKRTPTPKTVPQRVWAVVPAPGRRVVKGLRRRLRKAAQR